MRCLPCVPACTRGCIADRQTYIHVLLFYHNSHCRTQACLGRTDTCGLTKKAIAESRLHHTCKVWNAAECTVTLTIKWLK